MLTNPHTLTIGGASITEVLRASMVTAAVDYIDAPSYATGLPMQRAVFGATVAFSFVAKDIPAAIKNHAFAPFATAGTISMPNSPSNLGLLNDNFTVAVSCSADEGTLSIPRGAITYIGPVTYSRDIWANAMREIVVIAFAGTSGNAFTLA